MARDLAMVGPAHRRAPAMAFADTAIGPDTPGFHRDGWITVPPCLAGMTQSGCRALAHAYQD